MKKIIVAIILLITIVGCGSQAVNNSASQGKEVTFDQLKKDAFGGREERSNVIIKSEEELKALYTEMNWNDMPDVNFNKWNVVALFMGQMSSGGHGIHVKSVTVDDGTATVHTIETNPEGGMAPAVMTAPYCVVIIPKTENVIVE